MYLQLADGTKTPNLFDHMFQVQDQDGNKIWVREDLLYNLPDDELEAIIYSQPHFNYMNGIFDGIRNVVSNVKERRDAKVGAKVAIKEAKAGAITAGTYQSPLQNITGTIKDVFTGQQQQPMDTRAFEFPMITGDASVGVNKWYQNPITVGGLALGVIALGYFATRSRNNSYDRRTRNS